MGLLDVIADDAVSSFADFDESGDWTPVGGSVVRVAGIFDRESEVTDIGEMIQRDGVAASFNVATVKIPGAAIGDAFSIRGYDYRVVGIEPDGTGRTILVLGI